MADAVRVSRSTIEALRTGGGGQDAVRVSRSTIEALRTGGGGQDAVRASRVIIEVLSTVDLGPSLRAGSFQTVIVS